MTREQDRHLGVIDSRRTREADRRAIWSWCGYPDRKADASKPRRRAGRAGAGTRRAFLGARSQSAVGGRRTSRAAALAPTELAESLLRPPIECRRLRDARRRCSTIASTSRAATWSSQARTPEQVERLRMQNEKIRMRSDEFREMQRVIRANPPRRIRCRRRRRRAALVARAEALHRKPFHAQPRPDRDARARRARCRSGRSGIRNSRSPRRGARVPRFATIAGLKTDFPRGGDDRGR